MNKHKNRTRMYNILGEKWALDLNGFQFILSPNQDPTAWKALQFYAGTTPNAALEQALTKWLWEHPCPGEPVAEQMEMDLGTP